MAESKGFGLLTQGALTVNSMVQGFGKNQVYDASDVAEGYGLLTKYIASLECLSQMLRDCSKFCVST
ncbi:hypothetical protein [Acinetobacter sp. 1578804]|uniref:hypothetical protein n=1 Tax=Acinetobacter sp. 1578804 TaxID=1310689 RepID=UPI0012DB684C|nr:hypothetical protein [Acinetobacter sp. 1578804]